MENRVSAKKYISAFAAVILFFIAFFPYTLSGMSPFREFSFPDGELFVDRSVLLPCPRCLCIGCERRLNQSFKFMYTSSVLENETLEAELFIEGSRVEDGLHVRLSGPNFDIKPMEQQKVAKDSDETLKHSWLMLPKKTGNHKITLDLSELVNSNEGGASLYLNREKDKQSAINLESKSDAIFNIEIEVLTSLGLTSKVQLILQFIFAFIAFVLTTPILHSFFRKKKKNTSDVPTEDAKTN